MSANSNPSPEPAPPAAAVSQRRDQEEAPTRLMVGPSPHLRSPESVPWIMGWVAAALLPACLVSLWFFGIEALRVLTLSVVFCVAAEWLCLRTMKTPGSLKDFSALVAGILLGMNLPPTAPWWLIATGAVVAMLVAKHLFGGLGSNIFNPVLTARVFLLISWPVQMTTWVRPGTRGWVSADADITAVTEATPLGLLKEGRLQDVAASSQDLLFGNMGGSVGEIAALALLLGGAILLAKRIITWEIPATFIGSTALITGVAYLVGGAENFASPHFHVLSGGLILGALFMATDMVTSPLTFRGRVVFGLGCGVLTAVIRLWGGYPEGVSFAILLMNAVVPLLDHYMRPKTFGSATVSTEVAA